ncbi:MAG: hypothetical protein ACRD63_04165, partial [Pyrinomonadaceae bacterium]
MNQELIGMTVVGILLSGLIAFAGTSLKPDYSTDMKELRDKFNQDKGKVRLILLLSPTCPYCIDGASIVQKKVLSQIKDKDVRVYSVWVPILQNDAESVVPEAKKKLSDQRVSHYWDGKGELSKSYTDLLHLKHVSTGELVPAWDIYMIFPRDAEWRDVPPTPSYWMHQLPLGEERRLNGDTLTIEVKKLLQR